MNAILLFLILALGGCMGMAYYIGQTSPMCGHQRPCPIESLENSESEK